MMPEHSPSGCRWCLLSQDEIWLAKGGHRVIIRGMPDDYRTHLVRWLVRSSLDLYKMHVVTGGDAYHWHPEDVRRAVIRSPLVQALTAPCATAPRVDTPPSRVVEY